MKCLDYICLTPGLLSLLEFKKAIHSLKKSSKPLESQVITSIGIAQDL